MPAEPTPAPGPDDRPTGFVSSKAAAFAKWAETNPDGLAKMQAQLDNLPPLLPASDPLTPGEREDAADLAVASWRCFHCGEVFSSRKYAAEHFGAEEGDVPACRLSHSEGHLITYIRKLQRELASYRREDNLVLRAWDARVMEGVDAVRRAEETGYNRGVQDAKKMFEEELAAARRDGEAVRRDTLMDFKAWAEGRWRAEVHQRPEVNVYRDMLDATWKQVIHEAERLAAPKP